MINCVMAEEESEEDPSELIYDLPTCFMMTWEELMDRTSTTGYDIWSEDVPKTKNYSTSTNGGRHFKPQSNYQTPINGGRHFKPQHTDPNDSKKIAHITRGGETSNPHIWR